MAKATAAPAAFELLHPGLRRHVVEAGWADLTPIQQHAIPAILSGGDYVVEAPTAGGKTEAVLFPALSRAASKRVDSVQILYLAPLKALLNNLEGRAHAYSQACGLRAFKWHGDVPQSAKTAQLLSPPQLLLTTPESTEAFLLRKGEWPRFFGDLECVIIDEAHSFASGDRGGHLLSVLARLEQGVGRQPQRIAMSATIGNPAEMLAWLAGTSRTVGERIAVAPEPVESDFSIRFFNREADTDETPPQERALYRRFLALHAELERKRAIVFAGSRRRSEALAKAFARLEEARILSPVKVRTHHSSVSRFFREEAEALIQVANEHGLNGIISTSTLELGIDIGELDSVVQIEGLSSPSAFLQRVGRTGRRPGKPRVFRGLCTRGEALLLLIATVNLGLAGRAESLRFARRAFHLLAHQLMCISLQDHGIRPEQAWVVLSRAHCFSGIGEAEFRVLVDHMVARGYLRLVDGDLVVAEETERRFLGAGWRRLFAVFDSAPLYEVFDGKTQVGTLDASFVEVLDPPFHFVLGGRLWAADSVDLKHRIVRAHRARAGDPPKWETFGGRDVPFETAQEVGRLLRSEDVPWFVDEAGRELLEEERWKARSVRWVQGGLFLEAHPSGRAYLTTYAGDRINRTLARILDCEGLGSATARFDHVEVRAGVAIAKGLGRRIEEVIERISDGDLSDPRVLAGRLSKGQKLWRFSPFARCLPDRLLAEALVEQCLDVDGTIAYFQGGDARSTV